MPTFQLLSDLHFEYHRDQGAQFTDQLDPSGVDCLLLAGDICNLPQLAVTIGRFAAKFPRIIMVTGNHAYYGSSPREVHSALRGLEVSNPEFTWLSHSTVEVSGVTVAGSTLWFPPSPSSTIHTQGLRDFQRIREFDPWVYEENRKAQAFFQVQAGVADILLSHHMPHPSCVSERFLEGPAADYSHFFCCDMSTLIENAQPPLWVHGHSHDRKDFWVGETRILSNPLGYPREKECPARGPYRGKMLISAEPGPKGRRARVSCSHGY